MAGKGLRRICVPLGTLERLIAFPASLRDANQFLPAFPALKCWAIFILSLRDKVPRRQELRIAVGTAGCPAAPRTDPGVRFSRTGLFEDIRFRKNAIISVEVVSVDGGEGSLVASVRISPSSC